MTLRTVALKASLSMGFSRQEYWSGLPCPSPGDLSHPGTKPLSIISSALTGGFFTLVPPGKPIKKIGKWKEGRRNGGTEGGMEEGRGGGGGVISTRESDVVRLELNKEKKNVSVFIQLCLKKKRKFQ